MSDLLPRSDGAVSVERIQAASGDIASRLFPRIPKKLYDVPAKRQKPESASTSRSTRNQTHLLNSLPPP